MIFGNLHLQVVFKHGLVSLVDLYQVINYGERLQHQLHKQNNPISYIIFLFIIFSITFFTSWCDLYLISNILSSPFNFLLLWSKYKFFVKIYFYISAVINNRLKFPFFQCRNNFFVKTEFFM